VYCVSCRQRGFDEFVNSVAAVCVALRCPLSVYVLVVTWRFADGNVESGTSSFVYFLACCSVLEFNSGKLAVQYCEWETA